MVRSSWFMVNNETCSLSILTINHQLLTKMARILAIDYGGKRTGIAVTDPLQIIATGLATIDSKELIPYLKKYIAAEEVELVIIGLPVNWDDSDTHGTPLVKKVIKKMKQ